MSLLEKRPGEILLATFITAGIVITIVVAAAERVSMLAGQTPGQGFESGFVDMNFEGATWRVEEHGR